MKYFVYMLLCDKKTFYVGITDNLERRLAQHKNRESFFTKKFSCLELVYGEQHQDRSSAESREKQIKGWSVAKKKAIVENRKQDLIRLSKSHELFDKPSM
ncbi:MAG: GIY-YIG nuclease family protein [Candidatus Pacebacteria bacterium]|nr:GIY-YIG nuclease family protein [Candidatus Paceibacterota bacterium]